MNNKTNNKEINKCSLDNILTLIDGDTKVNITDKLLDKNILSVFNDKDLRDSANAFFKNNLNISETSRNSFMHRNTLIYRIEKIEKLTGLNIRNFKDAVTFLLLLLIYEKTKNIR